MDEDSVKRLLRWHPHLDVGSKYGTITDFHEWNVEFALAKFRAKQSNNEVVTFFTFRRVDGISIVETPYEGAHEKHVIQQTMRAACQIDLNVTMISSICECWIANETRKPDGTYEDMMARYKEVRYVPGREDGLMVATFARNGEVRMTRWVVKLKHNPANNRILARDDVNSEDGMQFYGANFGFFEPERHYPRGDIRHTVRPAPPKKPRPAPRPEPTSTEETVIILGPPKKENGNGNT